MLDFSNPLHIGFAVVTGAVSVLFLVFCVFFIFKKSGVRRSGDVVLTIFNWLLLIVFAAILAVVVTALCWNGDGFLLTETAGGGTSVTMFGKSWLQYAPASVWAVIFGVIETAFATVMGLALLAAVTAILLLCAILHPIRTKRKANPRTERAQGKPQKDATRRMKQEKPERTEPQVMDFARIAQEDEPVSDVKHANEKPCAAQMQTESATEYGVTGERFHKEFLKSLDDEQMTYSDSTPNRDELEALIRSLSQDYTTTDNLEVESLFTEGQVESNRAIGLDEGTEQKEFDGHGGDVHASTEELDVYEDLIDVDMDEDVYESHEPNLSDVLFAEVRAFADELEDESDHRRQLDQDSGVTGFDEITVVVAEPARNFSGLKQAAEQQEVDGTAVEEIQETEYADTVTAEDIASEPEEEPEEFEHINETDKSEEEQDEEDSTDYEDSAFANYVEEKTSAQEPGQESVLEAVQRTESESGEQPEIEQDIKSRTQMIANQKGGKTAELLDGAHAAEEELSPLAIGDRIILRSRPTLPPGYVLPVRVLSQTKSESKTTAKKQQKLTKKSQPRTASAVIAAATITAADDMAVKEQSAASVTATSVNSATVKEKATAQDAKPKRKPAAKKKTASKSTASKFVGRKRTTTKKRAVKQTEQIDASQDRSLQEQSVLTARTATTAQTKPSSSNQRTAAPIPNAMPVQRRYDIVGRGNAADAFEEYLKNK